MTTVSQVLNSVYGVDRAVCLYENSRALLSSVSEKSCDASIGVLFDLIRGHVLGNRMAEKFSDHHIQFLKEIFENTKVLVDQGFLGNTSFARGQIAVLKNTIQRLCECLNDCQRLLNSRQGFLKLSKLNQVEDINYRFDRHSLFKVDYSLFETLTWLTTEELSEVHTQFKSCGGLSQVNVECLDQRLVDGVERNYYKVNLGRGAHGVVRLIRSIDSGKLLAIKKRHVNASRFSEKHINGLIPNVNDGRLPLIGKVYFCAAHLSNKQIPQQVFSIYTCMELGIADLQTVLDALIFFRFMFLGQDQQVFYDDDIKRFYQYIELSYARLIAKNSSERFSKILESVGQRFAQPHLFNQPALLKQFLNTLTFKFLQSINQLHNAGYAHYDIKPDNFLLVKSGSAIAVKVVDFDTMVKLYASNRPYTGCTPLWRSPMQNGFYSFENHLKNDAYSAGVCILQIAGAGYENLKQLYESNRQFMNIGGAVEEVNHLVEFEKMSPDAIRQLSLRDLAERLTEVNPSSRLFVQDAIYSVFFQDPDTRLSDQEFSLQVERILRWQSLLSEAEAQKIRFGGVFNSRWSNFLMEHEQAKKWL